MKILTTPDPILTQLAKPVAKIDKKVLEFIEEMKKTLEATQNPKGVGLAAPQIGKPWRIFLARPILSSKTAKIWVFINPEIIFRSKEMTDGVPRKGNKLEGCLSIPGIWGYIRRHQTIKLRYKTPNNETRTKKFSGFMSTIIQHEVDHLNGHLFPAHVLEQKGKFYQIKKDKEGKEVLEEVEI